MKTLLAVAAGFVLLVAGQDNDAAIKKDKELLQGTWKIESLENEQGKKEDLQGATLTFSGDKVEFKKGDELKKASYTINPAGKPKEIDLKPEDKDITMQGIYRIEKDTLTICMVQGPNAARPTEFTAKEKCALVILKRDKQ
jgi:uncharacterized protein (TIGR03067 family)